MSAQTWLLEKPRSLALTLRPVLLKGKFLPSPVWLPRMPFIFGKFAAANTSYAKFLQSLVYPTSVMFQYHTQMSCGILLGGA